MTMFLGHARNEFLTIRMAHQHELKMYRWGIHWKNWRKLQLGSEQSSFVFWWLRRIDWDGLDMLNINIMLIALSNEWRWRFNVTRQQQTSEDLVGWNQGEQIYQCFLVFLRANHKFLWKYANKVSWILCKNDWSAQSWMFCC